MELLSVIKATSIWLFDFQELNPRGKYIPSGGIEWLKTNFNFLKYPSSISDTDERGGLAFTQGGFQIKEDLVIEVDLAIYNDGLVANTKSSTKATDAFIENVLNLAVKDFGLVNRPEMIRQRLYISELNVCFQQNLSSLNPRLQAFANRITSLLEGPNTVVFEASGIVFSFDPSRLGHHSNFVFERKLNTPFSEDRYYSRAPTHTDDHLSLLEELEDILIG